MMAEEAQAKRTTAYGEQRKFRGLEDFAIHRRLQKASDLVKKLLFENPDRNLQILELGCGFWGRNLKMLTEEFPSVQFTGIDFSVSNASNTKSLTLIAADLVKWKPNKQFDGVLSLAVAEHLLDPGQHFSQIYACLKQNGLAGLTTPTPVADFVLEGLGRLGIFDRDEIKDHQMYFTESGLKNLAKTSNLQMQEYDRISLGFNQWMLLRKINDA